MAPWHSGCNTIAAGPTLALLATPPTRACTHPPPDVLLEPGGVFFCLWAESRLRRFQRSWGRRLDWRGGKKRGFCPL